MDSADHDRAPCLRSTWYLSAEELTIYAYQQHQSELLGFILARTRGDRQRTEDIVRETMARLCCHARYSAPIDEQTLAPLLFTIAQRILIERVLTTLTLRQVA